ncbi:MAG: ROK family transcriptional regulator [Bacteroidales bacterium]|nr:ROK family transcriptional regulator [Bacteroidales bacterium]
MNTPQSRILSFLTRNDGCTIPKISESLGISIGTATKYISSLVEQGYLEDLGKTESVSGRRPHLYGLHAGAGHFLGFDVNDRYINVALMDFRGGILDRRLLEHFALDEPGSFDRLGKILKRAQEKAADSGYLIKNCCISLPGRIDNRTEDSYTFFHSPGLTLATRLREEAGLPLCLYNDTRAMTYGEFLKGAGEGTRNMLMINVNWGLGMGIVIDSRVYGGKSGYAGEFGHVYGFDNQIICRCGKRGCNETEISGQALLRNVVRRIREGESSILSPRVSSSDEPLSLHEVIDAVAHEDVLCIDAIEQIGRRLGEKVAGLINVFNPEIVVVGGELALTGDYLLDPMRMTINKHSIHLVSQDTRICRSALGMDAGAVGACLVARNRYLGERFEC